MAFSVIPTTKPVITSRSSRKLEAEYERLEGRIHIGSGACCRAVNRRAENRHER
jgi:hypothetical protein